ARAGERRDRREGAGGRRPARFPARDPGSGAQRRPHPAARHGGGHIGNALFVDVIRGAEAAAEAAGYTMLVVDTQESDQRERAAVENFLGAVDGLVLTSPRLSDAGIRAIAKQRPVIVLNRVVRGLPSVLTDGARGVRRA